MVHEINRQVKLLKSHIPYHESDHVLNIAYNVLCGNIRLEDIELNRHDTAYLNAIGAQRIPDPATAGDFTRWFKKADIMKLMECVNTARIRVWKESRKDSMEEALIDVDGTIARTYGECKEGMDVSYKGIWGYAPLVISLGNTKEVLYLVNRPGNRPSHDGCMEWIDRAIGLVKRYAKRVCIRGDTDFSLTGNFDRWSEQADFVFGMNAHAVLERRAGELSKESWKEVRRKPKYEVKTQKRKERSRKG